MGVGGGESAGPEGRRIELKGQIFVACAAVAFHCDAIIYRSFNRYEGTMHAAKRLRPVHPANTAQTDGHSFPRRVGPR